MVSITEYLLQEQAKNDASAINPISKKDVYSLYRIDSEIAIVKFTLLGDENKMIVPNWLWREAKGKGFMNHLNPKAYRTLVLSDSVENGKLRSSFADYLKRRHYARVQAAPVLNIHTAIQSLNTLKIEAKIDCRTFDHWKMIETKIKTQKETELSASVKAFLQGIVWAEEKLIHRKPYQGIHASYIL